MEGNIKIDGFNAVKDLYSGALLSTDTGMLSVHKAKKMSRKEDAERINKLENDIVEIKEMLKQLIVKQ
jgi:hypothetical protein